MSLQDRGHYLTSFIPQIQGAMVAEAPDPGFPVTSFPLSICSAPSHTHPHAPGLYGGQWAEMEPPGSHFQKCYSSHL